MRLKVSDSTVEYSEIINNVITKIVDAHSVNPTSLEPGVEMAHGLSPTIDAAIRDAVKSSHDLSEISKGIFIGAFRRDRSLVLEAHKTIRLITQEIIQSIYRYKGDMNKAVQGILGGVSAIAREHKLNPQAATIISREDIVYALNKIGISSDDISIG